MPGALERERYERTMNQAIGAAQSIGLEAVQTQNGHLAVKRPMVHREYTVLHREDVRTIDDRGLRAWLQRIYDRI